MTLTYELIGSPAYLSPEGFTSSRVDYRADIFSFGIMAYELLLGEKPFVAESISRYAHLIQYELPIAPVKHDPDFPDVLQDLIAGMLQKDPQDRISDAAHIEDVFKGVLDETEIPAGTGKYSQKDWV